MAREYKDSGIEWIGQIPKEWEVIKGKHLLNLMSRPVREMDDVVTCFRDGEVILRSERRTEGFTMSDKEIGYQGINEGDIVIHGMDGFAGAIGISKSTGKGSPVLIVCNPKGTDDSRYIIYYLRTLAITNVFLALATGIRERSCDLRWNKISVIPFIRPQSIIQQKIADYLDKVCGEVDEMVALQETMIEELKAYKQSVITEAVTKGLNPNVPMRNSGIDWIGEIPEHWKVSRLKFYSAFINGFAFSSDWFTIDKGCKVIRIGDISQNLDFDGCVRANAETDSLQQYRIKNNDIVIAMSGATTGKCCIAKDVEEAYINQRVGIIRCENYAYTYYQLQADYFMEYIKLNNAGSAQPNVSGSSIGNFSILFPPEAEQHAIASYLDTKCSEIDSLIALKQAKIEELQEYKKSVIYEYVTGKKEVL